ncbi:MAG: 2-oxoglutarate dehydrogenase E1 component [Alphaproteobacteria bacterium]
MNLPYTEALYRQFQHNPESVDAQWRGYFTAVDELGLAPTMQVDGTRVQVTGQPQLDLPLFEGATETVAEAATAQAAVARLVQMYRYFGHRAAKVNPLASDTTVLPELKLSSHGLTETQWNDIFATSEVLPQSHAKLSEIVEALAKTYTQSLTVQLGDIPNAAERTWLRKKLEATQSQPNFSTAERVAIYDDVYRADAFEKYLHHKFVGMKRFSLEGGDALIPMLHNLANRAAEAGAEHMVFGMAHRGRLNVLTNILGKPLEEMFAGFADKLQYETDENHAGSMGDVKYHFGKSKDLKSPSGNTIHLSLLNNPSHLEAVNPVVMGSARAKQERYGAGKAGWAKVVPLLIHGDAAFAGQGVVAESLAMSYLEGFHVGGTLHIVINNQVAFTANPFETFSGDYCTDMARLLQCPIFHVNGDDVEACVYAMQLALDFRNLFHKDVMIDLVCYRRWGHNEGDDPTFTQPVMYEKIKTHPVPASLYRKQLVAAGVKEKDLQKAEDDFQKKMNAAFEKSAQGAVAHIDMFGDKWKGFSRTVEKEPVTTVSAQRLTQMASTITTYPKGFTPNVKVAKIIEQRAGMLQGKEPLNWGAAEAAAYGALLAEGTPIRLVGQDVLRGTFSHRHIGLVDSVNGNRHYAISAMAKEGASLQVVNSLLSEEAVVGYEYGYSLAAPQTLTVWEAQFGDFANGAQIAIDQFIASAEIKWQRLSGLVLQLPHGFEGQGPEHSSARLERFLQLSADNNWSVVTPTTPAQMFHLLRRQMLRKTRKPLVVMTPKSLLRHPQAISSLADLTEGAYQPVIGDSHVKAKDVTRVILCGGKVYYDLLAHREALNRADIAIVRIEELYPLPVEALDALLQTYKTQDIIWVQEEPRNQGAWTYLLDNAWPRLGLSNVRYVGRASSASPAVGSPKRHAEEQRAILTEAFK